MSEFGKFETKIKTEESSEDGIEKERKEIEMIEKSPLEYQDKMELALLYLGEKPAIWIDTPISHRVFYKSERKREEVEILNKLSVEKENLEQVLKDLNLVYELQKNEVENEETYSIEYSFLVAKNSENFSRLKNAIKAEDSKEIGLILGYPKTAVEAFDSGKELDYKKLPEKEIKKLTEEETSKFLDFHLSENNWQEELNLTRRHQALIKEKFPNLYKEVIKYGVDQIEIKESKKEDLEKSSINKIIGDADEKEKEKMRKEYAERFADQEWEEFGEKEIEKSPGVIKVINFVNKETNKLLKYYGLEKFDIKSNNVHLFYQDTFKELIPTGKTIIENTDAFCSLQNQAICFNTDQVNTKIDFAVRLFHEDCHLKAHQAIRAYKDREEGIVAKSGIAFIPKEGTIRLLNLYEGLTEELTKNFYHKIIKKSPLFKEDIEKLEKLKDSTENETIKASDEIYDYQNNEWRKFGYSKQREILNALIEKLYSKNKNEFEDKEEVFDLFAKSVFTGKLNWGRLVNQTFGKGTFKKLAQLDANVEELEKFVQELK